MSESWYYVLKGQRQGPVDVGVITTLVQSQQLREDDYIWKKGFDNWRKLKDVAELQNLVGAAPVVPEFELPKQTETPQKFRLGALDPEEKSIYVRIGVDRGGAPAEYGPYSPSLVKRLYQENRVNGRSQFFVRGRTDDWGFLADVEDFEEEDGEHEVDTEANAGPGQEVDEN